MTEWAVLVTVFAQSQNPHNSCCALQARPRNLSFILPCRNISKAKTHAACFGRWWQLCIMLQPQHRELSDMYFVPVFPNLRSPCVSIKGRIFIQHVSIAHGSPGRSACTIRTELSRALWQFTISVEDFQHSSYVCKLGCSLGLVHKGTQVCIMLWTSYQSSGWFASTNDRVSCTCDRFCTVTESPKQLLCLAG